MAEGVCVCARRVCLVCCVVLCVVRLSPCRASVCLIVAIAITWPCVALREAVETTPSPPNSHLDRRDADDAPTTTTGNTSVSRQHRQRQTPAAWQQPPQARNTPAASSTSAPHLQVTPNRSRPAFFSRHSSPTRLADPPDFSAHILLDSTTLPTSTRLHYTPAQ